MRKLLLVAAFLALWGAAPVQASSTPVVLVLNESTKIPQADVVAALPAFQIAVSRDLAKAWGTDALLTTDANMDADMVVVITNDAPGMCLCFGYHSIDWLGRPVSYVLANPSLEMHESWQLTFTHELFEMLVDPWINHFAMWNGRTWLVEVGDPCESGYYAYWINGVVISDFILPKWYNKSLPGKYDQAGLFTRSGQIGRHGYASYRQNGQWLQVHG